MSFQTFDPPGTDHHDVRQRISELRSTFAALGIDGVLVPHEDAYQSEYVPPSEERLSFVTGFTGSAGRAIVLADRALFATDGRYTLQARRQVPDDLFHIVSTEPAAKDWIAKNLDGVRLGYAPELHARQALERLSKAAPGVILKPLDVHPVDTIWPGRPAPPAGKVRLHPQALAGSTPAEKLAAIRKELDADGLLIAAADTVSWLLNWRGADVAHTPLVLSRAFVPKEGPVVVFVDQHKLPNDVPELRDGLFEVERPDNFIERLEALSTGRTILADPAAASDAALSAIEALGTLKSGDDPAARLKAIKNGAEIAGMRAAHQRDGVAMVRFLAFLEAEAVGRSEIEIAQRLEALRVEAGALDVSFDSIVGSGPNGAIVHYRVDASTDRTVEAGDPILIDSGGQYADGTTDITRTVVAGEPTDEFRIAFTRVLKGHIALARQRFPVGASGAELDTLARAALWNAGADYLHGTGHGIGAALAVHEGPPGISKRNRSPLAPGMILSNEPGYYREGAFGIRIENLVLIREPRIPPGGETQMLSFETLTYAPIDTRLIAPHLLSAAEIGWLDAYHATVRGTLSADLAEPERAFLEARCRPIANL